MISPDFEKYKIAKGGKFYWSGKECAVKLKDTWLDESLQLTLQVLENNEPHYHYSEYTPRKITPGVRLISGEISMNFTNFSEIFTILHESGRPVESQEITPTSPLPPINLGKDIPNISIANPESIKNYVDNYNKYQEQQLTKERVFTTNSYDLPLFNTSQELTLDIIFGLHVAQDRIFNTKLGKNWGSGADWVHPLNQKINSPGTGIRLLGFRLISYNLMVDDSGRPVVTTSQYMAKNIQQIN